MRTHTSEYKNNIKQMGREIKAIVTAINGSTSLEIPEEKVNSITYSYNANILKSNMKELDLDIAQALPLNSVVNLQFGVKVNDEYEMLDYGYFIVYKVEAKEDTKSFKIKCYDKMLNFMKDYEPINISYPTTIKNYLIALCNSINVAFKSQTFENENQKLTKDVFSGVGYTYRDVLDKIAEVTGSLIHINNSQELELKYIGTQSVDTIDAEMLNANNVTFGETYGPINSIVFSRSAESDNVFIQDEESIQTNGVHEVKIIDNDILNDNNRSDYLAGVLNALDCLTYTINDYTSKGITYLEIGDRYKVKIDDKTYDCVMLNDTIKITQGLEEQIKTEMPSQTQTDYTKADKTDRKINQAYIIVDKQNQTIEATVSKVEAQDTKIASITQSVDEINSKIKDVTNTTVSGETTDGLIDVLEGVNASEPVKIVIHPIKDDIDYDYPCNDYPQKDYSKIKLLRFTNLTTNEEFDYEIPYGLLWYDENNYDTFTLDIGDYDNKSCYITKKVKYIDANGSKQVLSEPETITLPWPTNLELTTGDYEIELISYENGYIYVQLMASNIYTTQFPTRVEVTSEISQKADSITMSVAETYATKTDLGDTDKKLSSQITQTASSIRSEVKESYATKNDLNETQKELSSSIEQTSTSIKSEVKSTYATKDSVNTSISTLQQTDSTISANVSKKLNSSEFTNANITLKINDGTSSAIIKADKVDITGVITAINGNTTTKINGGKIETNTLSADTINGGTIDSSSISIGTTNYYLRMGSTWTKHPEVSGLNITGSGGIAMNNHSIGDFGGASGNNSYSITSGKDLSLRGNSNLYLRGGSSSSNILVYTSAGFKSLNVAYLARNPSDTSKTEAITQLTGNNDTYIRMNTSVVLKPNGSSGGAFVWGTESYNAILTKGGSPSTLSIKENVRKKDISNIPNILRQIELYDYKYIDKVENGKQDYGYIIDYLESIDGIKDYFTFNKIERDGLKYETINHEHLEKFLLASVVSQQKEIDMLKEEIKSLKESDK